MISYVERTRIKDEGARLSLEAAITMRAAKARAEFNIMACGKDAELSKRISIIEDLIDEIKDLKRDLDALPKPKVAPEE